MGLCQAMRRSLSQRGQLFRAILPGLLPKGVAPWARGEERQMIQRQVVLGRTRFDNRIQTGSSTSKRRPGRGASESPEVVGMPHSPCLRRRSPTPFQRPDADLATPSGFFRERGPTVILHWIIGLMEGPIGRLKGCGDCPVRSGMGDHGRSTGITPLGTVPSAGLGGLIAPPSLGLRTESQMCRFRGRPLND